jgi:hypothetical protein
MAQQEKASAGIGSLATGSQVPFTLHAKHFKYGKPLVSVEGIAGAEAVSFWVRTGGSWEELDDGTGTQVAFSATYAADVFNSPGEYGFTKTVTVSPVTLYVNDGR